MILAEFYVSQKKKKKKETMHFTIICVALICPKNHLVEVVKCHPGYGSSNSRGNGLAGIPNKVWYGKYLGGILLVIFVLHFKVPVEERREREREGEVS